MQGLVLFVLTDFPEVPFPSLVNDSEHTGDGSANNSDLGKFGSLGQLGPALPLSPPAVPAAHPCCEGLKHSLGHGCIAFLRHLLRGKAFSVPLGRGFPLPKVSPFSSPSLTCRITTSPECLSQGPLLSSSLATSCLLLSLHPDVKHFPSPFSKRKLMVFSCLYAQDMDRCFRETPQDVQPSSGCLTVHFSGPTPSNSSTLVK